MSLESIPFFIFGKCGVTSSFKGAARQDAQGHRSKLGRKEGKRHQPSQSSGAGDLRPSWASGQCRHWAIEFQVEGGHCLGNAGHEVRRGSKAENSATEKKWERRLGFSDPGLEKNRGSGSWETEWNCQGNGPPRSQGTFSKTELTAIP